MKDIILTGDRATGPLHIGHYVGSLKKRVTLQYQYDCPLIMIADMQALTDNAHHPQKVSQNVLQVAADYLAVGLKPELNTIFIQSLIPELSELTMFYLNFVTMARCKRNPTVKDEMLQKGYGDNVPVGFFIYPISQAADITAFRANYIPVGEDQLPMLEQTNEVVRHINRYFGVEVLRECNPLLSKVQRLPGTDGKAKMGKSANNAIFLSDGPDDIQKKVMGMYTDPQHIHVEDPGKVEGNPVFQYLDAFDSDAEKLQELKEHYTHGGLGDMVLKRRLNEILQAELEPIRRKRKEVSQYPAEIMKMLKDNSEKCSEMAAQTLRELREVFTFNY